MMAKHSSDYLCNSTSDEIREVTAGAQDHTTDSDTVGSTGGEGRRVGCPECLGIFSLPLFFLFL
jgi:hypothetical protein